MIGVLAEIELQAFAIVGKCERDHNGSLDILVLFSRDRQCQPVVDIGNQRGPAFGQLERHARLDLDAGPVTGSDHGECEQQ